MTEPLPRGSNPAPPFKVGTLDDVEVEIANAVAVQLGVARTSITSAASFEEMGADLCDVAEMIVLLEETFGIEIPADHVDLVLTVGDLIAEVKQGLMQAPVLERPRSD